MTSDPNTQPIAKSATDTPEPTAPKIRLPNRKTVLIGITCLVVISLVIMVFRAVTAETFFTVSCSSIKGGYECKLTPSGARIADSRVCWEIHDVCENGVKSMVAKCVRGTLQPGQEVRSLIANSEFSNYVACDKLSARAIESVFIEVVRQAPTPMQK